MHDKIEANYEQLEQISNRFNNQSQAIHQMIQSVKNSMSKLENGGWEGRGSDAFFSEMHGELLPATNRLQQALEEASQVSKRIVQTMKQAEEEAAAPFRSS